MSDDESDGPPAGMAIQFLGDLADSQHNDDGEEGGIKFLGDADTLHQGNLGIQFLGDADTLHQGNLGLMLNVEPVTETTKPAGLLGLMGLRLPAEANSPEEQAEIEEQWKTRERAYSNAMSDTGSPKMGINNTPQKANPGENYEKSWKILADGSLKVGQYVIKTAADGDSFNLIDAQVSVEDSEEISNAISSTQLPQHVLDEILSFLGRPTPGSTRSLLARPTGVISSDTLVQLGVLGKGASGRVLKCFHVPSSQIIALKCIDIGDKGKRDQMMKELEQFSSTNTPYIVSFYGAFFEEGTTKLALEFMNRGSLQYVLKKCGPLREEVLASVAKQTLLGLLYLHDRYQVHRDIKPGNILINHMGEVKVSDFGILGQLDATMDMHNTFVGTTIYMSPERICSQQYSYSADIWSLGMSLITLATGSYPLSTNHGYWGLVTALSNHPPPTLPERFSPEFRDFVRCCLIKKPHLRWPATRLLAHPFVMQALPQHEVLQYWPESLDMHKKEMSIVTSSDLKIDQQTVQSARERAATRERTASIDLDEDLSAMEKTVLMKTTLVSPLGGAHTPVSPSGSQSAPSITRRLGDSPTTPSVDNHNNFLMSKRDSMERPISPPTMEAIKEINSPTESTSSGDGAESEKTEEGTGASWKRMSMKRTVGHGVRGSSMDKSIGTRCSHCNTQASTTSCGQCGVGFCEDCATEIHQRGIFRTHRLTPIGPSVTPTSFSPPSETPTTPPATTTIPTTPATPPPDPSLLRASSSPSSPRPYSLVQSSLLQPQASLSPLGATPTTPSKEGSRLGLERSDSLPSSSPLRHQPGLAGSSTPDIDTDDDDGEFGAGKSQVTWTELTTVGGVRSRSTSLGQASQVGDTARVSASPTASPPSPSPPNRPPPARKPPTRPAPTLPSARPIQFVTRSQSSSAVLLSAAGQARHQQRLKQAGLAKDKEKDKDTSSPTKRGGPSPQKMMDIVLRQLILAYKRRMILKGKNPTLAMPATGNTLAAPGEPESQVIPGLAGDKELHVALIHLASTLGLPLAVILREYQILIAVQDTHVRPPPTMSQAKERRQTLKARGQLLNPATDPSLPNVSSTPSLPPLP